ncbi:MULTISPECIES: hypothetical protein [unclassified Streptomyces]|uniref:hypothetical protein n=1 Tax=unclassified Streptomyces TaxID=2593676 RepID=UPI0040430964
MSTTGEPDSGFPAPVTVPCTVTGAAPGAATPGRAKAAHAATAVADASLNTPKQEVLMIVPLLCVTGQGADMWMRRFASRGVR